MNWGRAPFHLIQPIDIPSEPNQLSSPYHPSLTLHLTSSALTQLRETTQLFKTWQQCSVSISTAVSRTAVSLTISRAKSFDRRASAAVVNAGVLGRYTRSSSGTPRLSKRDVTGLLYGIFDYLHLQLQFVGASIYHLCSPQTAYAMLRNSGAVPHCSR